MDDVTMSDLYAIIAERDAEIAALRAQVAAFEAWKAAVPVDALQRIIRDVSSPSLYDASFAARNWLRTLGTDT